MDNNMQTTKGFLTKLHSGMIQKLKDQDKTSQIDHWELLFRAVDKSLSVHHSLGSIFNNFTSFPMKIKLSNCN